MADFRVTINSGLCSNKIYQRDFEKNTADIPIWGTIEPKEEGKVDFLLVAELQNNGKRVIKNAEIKDGVFNITLEGIPAGQYSLTIQIFIGGNIVWQEEYEHIGVGDIFILAGQSNMFGCGSIVGAEQPSKMVHSFNSAYEWTIACDPLMNLNSSPDEVYWDPDIIEAYHKEKTCGQQEAFGAEIIRNQRAKEFEYSEGCAGLGISFGKEIAAYTGVPVGLVNCSKGGTSMEHWSPLHLEEGAASLYGAMVKRIRAVGGKFRGFLWYQGENEASGTDTAKFINTYFKFFIESLRKLLDFPHMPVAYVQLAKYHGEEPRWKVVQENQRKFESTCENVVLVSSIDSILNDVIHLDTQSLKRIGKRMAIAMKRLAFNEKSIKIGPRLKSAIFEESKILRLTFEEFNGKLLPSERVYGFTLKDVDNKDILLKNVSVDYEKEGSIVIELLEDKPEKVTLWYGVGNNPNCNLTDELDMAAPAFGPLEIR